MKSNAPYLLFLLTMTFTCSSLISQDVGGKTLVSQSRTTTANIGKSDITIKYHSPSVNGRKIFGGIVPYDFVVEGKEYPWRAGSNQRTTISFSHDVKVNGRDLAAGTYGFLILVSEDEWTLIFSSGTSWGAFNYDTQNDVLRETVKVQKRPFQEWLSYEFNHPKSESVDIELRWEESAISFNISTDATANRLAELNKIESKTTNDLQDLAIWTLEQDETKVDEAISLLDQAIEKIPEVEREVMQSVYEFACKIMKADLLIQKGELEKGEKLKNEMLEFATGYNMYYYALSRYLVKGKKDEAYQLLTDAIQRSPDNFQNHIAMGEYYLKEGNQAKATKHFKTAFEMTSEQESSWLNYTRYLYLQNKLVLERSAPE